MGGGPQPGRSAHGEGNGVVAAQGDAGADALSSMAHAVGAGCEVRWSLASDGYAAGAQAQALNMHFGFLW